MLLPEDRCEMFVAQLNNANSHGCVQAAYQSFLGIRHEGKGLPICADLHHAEVCLWEMKWANFIVADDSWARGMAQAVCMLRRLHAYRKPIPTWLAVAHEDYVGFWPSSDFIPTFCMDWLDWTRTPSNPDPRLVRELIRGPYNSCVQFSFYKNADNHSSWDVQESPYGMANEDHGKLSQEETALALLKFYQGISGK